jgi:hypothetical protein
MGPWIVPGVRAENQLRVYLYKFWLHAIEDGIGDPQVLRNLHEGIDSDDGDRYGAIQEGRERGHCA